MQQTFFQRAREQVGAVLTNYKLGAAVIAGVSFVVGALLF